MIKGFMVMLYIIFILANMAEWIDFRLLDLLTLSLTLIAYLQSRKVVTDYGVKNKTGGAVNILSSGMLVWLIVGIFFFLSAYRPELRQFDIPIQIIFALAVFPLTTIGLVRAILAANVAWKEPAKRRKWFWPAVLLIILAAPVIALQIYNYISDSGSTPGMKIINYGYGLGDLSLAFLAAVLFRVAMEFAGGRLFRVWAAITGFVALILLGDILYIRYFEMISAKIWPYQMVGVIWTGAILLFGYSMTILHEMVTNVREKVAKA